MHSLLLRNNKLFTVALPLFELAVHQLIKQWERDYAEGATMLKGVSAIMLKGSLFL